MTGTQRHPTAAELRFLQEARVGRLATVDAHGRPSVVPCCFAVVAEATAPVLVSVLDNKPKRVGDQELARVRHIRTHPDVALVVDHYEEDWTRLAFVLIRGRARILAPAEAGHAEALAALRTKYPQYRAMALEDRLVVRIEALRAFSWRADGAAFS